MSEQTSFGRRGPPHSPIKPKVLVDQMLSPEAEAFRAQLIDGQVQPETDFAQWRSTQQVRPYWAWLAAFALLCPGVLCFIFNAPRSVSAALEIAGVAANVWLRRERRRHLSEIAGWEPRP